MRQEGSLAATHDTAPGLPRGRSSLPPSDVAAAQRQRLLNAAVATVAETGLRAATVAGIVRRAKVSRATFYAHFTDKDDCVGQASAHGWRQLVDAVTAATRACAPDTEAELVWRAGCRAFLNFLAVEPAFARLFYVAGPSAGEAAFAGHDKATEQFAAINRDWHEHARRQHPDWPEVPFDAFIALSGATTELIGVRVRHGRTDELPALEDTLTALHLAVLGAQRWPRAADPPPGAGQLTATGDPTPNQRASAASGSGSAPVSAQHT
jgi:AcrR family transcriptional regulator